MSPPENENPPKSSINTFGQIVGLITSVAFLAFVSWVLFSGKLGKMNSQELRVLYAFVIILGGPIPFSLSVMEQESSWAAKDGRPGSAAATP